MFRPWHNMKNGRDRHREPINREPHARLLFHTFLTVGNDGGGGHVSREEQ